MTCISWSWSLSSLNHSYLFGMIIIACKPYIKPFHGVMPQPANHHYSWGSLNGGKVLSTNGPAVSGCSLEIRRHRKRWLTWHLKASLPCIIDWNEEVDGLAKGGASHQPLLFRHWSHDSLLQDVIWLFTAFSLWTFYFWSFKKSFCFGLAVHCSSYTE